LALATRHGAQALGVEADAGTLEPGKLANLAVVQLTSSDADPHERLLADDTRVVETILRGRRLTAGSW
jgi:imidazolonepropionase-like amidohydrolase